MPTFKDTRTGAETVTGDNSALSRLAQRRPDLFVKVDNASEPATADETQARAAAENYETQKKQRRADTQSADKSE